MKQKNYFSSQEMLDEFRQQHEIKGMFDDNSTQAIHREIEREADQIDTDKRRKAAKSINDLSRMYIVH